MNLSARLSSAVRNYAGDDAGRRAWVDAKLEDVGAGKPRAVDELAKALRLTRIEVVEIATAALEGVAGHKGIGALLDATRPGSFQADRGGGGAGATLRAHGRFDDSSIIKDTLIRKFGRGAGEAPTAIVPLVSNLPPKAFDGRGMLAGYADRQLPATTDPPHESAKDLWPYTNEWTRGMVLKALDDATPEIEARLKAFRPPIELSMGPLLERAARNVIDRVAQQGLDDDAEPNALRKALSMGIADEGARLLEEVRFPRDPERQIDEGDVQRHCQASFIIGTFEAFGISARPGLGGVHDMLEKHGLEKKLEPGLFRV